LEKEIISWVFEFSAFLRPESGVIYSELRLCELGGTKVQKSDEIYSEKLALRTPDSEPE
jgi:hypothetical protein